MKGWVLAIVFLVTCSNALGQTREELEEQRNKALTDIQYLDSMIEKTSVEKSESMNELNMIRRKLNLRENVIEGLLEEQELLEH